MAILFHVNQKTGRSFSSKDILRLKDCAISEGHLRENCYVLNPDGIFDLAGLQTRYTGRHEKANRKALPDEIEILYYRLRENGHFVAGVSGIVAYDSLEASDAVKFGTLRTKRIFMIV